MDIATIYSFRHFQMWMTSVSEATSTFSMKKKSKEEKKNDDTIQLRREQTALHGQRYKELPNKHICYKFSRKDTSVCRENITADTEIVFQNQKQCNGIVSVPLNKQPYRNGSRTDSQMSMFLSTEWIKPDGIGSTWLLLFHS